MNEHTAAGVVFGQVIPAVFLAATLFYSILAGRKGWLIYRLKRLRRRPAE